MERALDVINGFDAGIQVFDEKGQTDADHQADNDA